MGERGRRLRDFPEALAMSGICKQGRCILGNVGMMLAIATYACIGLSTSELLLSMQQGLDSQTGNPRILT